MSPLLNVPREPPDLPEGAAGNLVAELLQIPSLQNLFKRNGQLVELFREQAIDGIVDGKWLSGVMDRLHLHRDASGRVTRVQIIDFKTDAVDEIDTLVQRYSAQMKAYREVMHLAHPNALIECILLTTRCREWVFV